MSQDFHVFLDQTNIPPAVDWQTAIRSLHFDLEFDNAFDPFKSSGYVPCMIGTSSTGFEYALSSSGDVIPAYPALSSLVGGFDSVVSFTFGGDVAECASAAIAAATLTTVSQGMMYDPQDDLRFAGVEAIDYAHQVLKELAGSS